MNKTLEDARARLKEKNIDPSLANYLYDCIKEKKGSINEFNEGIEEIIKGKPVQYIIGNVDFYGYIININKNVLIPRFETERLVELTIEKITKKFKKPTILDIGTGSGCIAIALKKEIECEVDAIDISNDALNLAKENAQNNDVKITFYKSNILRNVSKKFDVIISNPPYLSEDYEVMDIVKDN
ncbi:MAG: peptide chain release factor N(5)-glutamine methyltransferase, partial [Romboutsia sp.]|nr:peptide chain release factor N(5)-glutamine methyltransferase [Romboutsia sp.]